VLASSCIVGAAGVKGRAEVATAEACEHTPANNTAASAHESSRLLII